jgi:plastocyanin
MRWTIALAALGLSVLGLSVFSLATAGPARAATTTVDVGNYYFCTEADSGAVCETDVTAGDTVTWSVEEGTHRVVQCADDTFTGCPSAGGFDGGNFSTGATFSQTFATAGTYFYECHIHTTEMRGKIVVAAAATNSPSPTVAASSTGTAAPTATVAAVPKTGGPPLSGGTDVWQYALLVVGMTLLGGSGFAFAVARKR